MNEKSLLSSTKLQTLMRQVDARYSVDPEVEDLLIELSEQFIDSVTNFSCALAKNRRNAAQQKQTSQQQTPQQNTNSTLTIQDLNLHLQRTWNIHVPGFEHDSSNVDLESVLYDEKEKKRMQRENEIEEIVYKDMQAREKDLRRMERNRNNQE